MRWVVFLTGLVCSLHAADFSKEVQPLFEKRCQGCHGPRQQISGLRLDDGEAALKGGYSGPVILPGKSATSPIITRITSDKKGFMMPPGGARLTAAEVASIRAWIDEGAKWPAGAAKSATAAARPSHWSFQPVHRPAAPDTRNRTWARNAIDAFILARLESEGLTPSPEAGRITLIRRVTLDLTGLPPTPAEVAAFVNDNRPDAYDRLVDRLLASPHYGEKWARHWLDLARYADSDGYEKDQVRPWAWRYRQWVIDSLNHDKPFDEFTIEQLAGDLLPSPTTEQVVATGFQRNTLTNREAGVDRAEARFEQNVNRANTVSTVWLGLTTGCAQCHNHKYDPISQKEHYQLFAIWDHTDERTIDAPMPGEEGPYLAALTSYEKQLAAWKAKYQIDTLQAEWETHLREAIDHPGRNLEWDFSMTSMRAMFDYAERTLKTEPARRSRRDARRLTAYFITAYGPDYGRDKAKSELLKTARKEFDEFTKTLPPYTQAQVLGESDDKRPSHLRVRGDWKTEGIPVEPGALAVLPPVKAPEGTPFRLAFARWLVTRENPLTARVTVNRTWQELFGRGLVRTSEDFGTQGEKPTHPELLDFLATEFVDRGWSFKSLQRLIVTSATYRQASRVRPELAQKDPENILLARQSRVRLPAELIRDSALAASGLLNPAVGGPSVKPPMPKGVAELGYGNSVKWVATEGAERYRRGLYIHYQRTTPYPLLVNFDAPDTNVTCSRRRVSNTPLQALNLMNDPLFFEAAQALAVRTLREAPPKFDDRLNRAFEFAIGRAPSPTERQRIQTFYASAPQATLIGTVPEGIPQQEASTWTAISRVLLNLDEFLTRE